ncbi:MAG: fucose isomerase [Kiritimatiellia bacterium]
MINMPEVRMGVVGVSRDCFPIELAAKRLKKVIAECRKLKLNIVPCSVIVESEADALNAAAEMEAEGVNAITVYLGNFGPEGPSTILARILNKPFMLTGAAEESRNSLVEGRGDAFCGMLSACFNAQLRNQRAYVPPRPVGLPRDVARNIAVFTDVARVGIALSHLKIFSFGPRPQDFYACNAPIGPLYDLGIEVMENSELDLLDLYKSNAGRKREISAIARDMAGELGQGNKHPEKLNPLAQYELTLTDFFEENLGSRQFGVYANKCWPAFESMFGFVPCFVNSRLAGRGIPVACEVDIYGALSEYMAQAASMSPATILDVNNTVPPDIKIRNRKNVPRSDMFMGFHCGNSSSSLLKKGYAMKYQLIMHRLLETGKKPNITCGTLEGRFKPGPATIFRLQSTPGGELRSYMAEGHVIDADPSSFGCIGIFGIRDFARFYRYVLLEKAFPHHTAAVLKHAGSVLYESARLLGVEDINTPRTAGRLYPAENPFAT